MTAGAPATAAWVGVEREEREEAVMVAV